VDDAFISGELGRNAGEGQLSFATAKENPHVAIAGRFENDPLAKFSVGNALTGLEAGFEQSIIHMTFGEGTPMGMGGF
jgi:hypothetical protein